MEQSNPPSAEDAPDLHQPSEEDALGLYPPLPEDDSPLAEDVVEWNEELPLPLTETTLDIIFTFLHGSSLQNCKLVNSIWYHYINSRVWKYRCNRRELRKSLDQNVRKGRYVHNPMLYVDLPICGFVSNTTSNKLAVRSFASTPLAHSRICIVDVSDYSFWVCQDAFTTVSQEALYDEFMLGLSEELLVCRIVLKYDKKYVTDAQSYEHIGELEMKKRTLSLEYLQVWSLITHRKIHQEYIIGLESIEMSKSHEAPHILVVFTVFYMEVWNCQGENIVKTRVPLPGNFFMSSSFVFPHIMMSSFVEDETRHTIQVWKLLDDHNGVQLKVDVYDREHFFCDKKTAIRNHITHMKYVDNHFLMSTIVDLPGQDGNNPGLCLRSFGNDGQLLQEVHLSDYSPHEFVNINTFEDRIFVEVDDDLLVIGLKAKDLGVKSINPIPYEKLANFSLLAQPMLGLVEVGEARMVDELGGQLLRICKVNFWREY